MEMAHIVCKFYCVPWNQVKPVVTVNGDHIKGGQVS